MFPCTLPVYFSRQQSSVQICCSTRVVWSGSFCGFFFCPAWVWPRPHDPVLSVQAKCMAVTPVALCSHMVLQSNTVFTHSTTLAVTFVSGCLGGAGFAGYLKTSSCGLNHCRSRLKGKNAARKPKNVRGKAHPLFTLRFFVLNHHKILIRMWNETETWPKWNRKNRVWRICQ